MIQVRFLTENKTEDPRCDAEFGLSMIITADDRRILFDTGYSDMLIRNAARLHESLADIDCCVLSHSHDDHTNGVPHFLKVNDHAPVYMHRDALVDSFEEIDGAPGDEQIGIQWDPADYPGRIVLTDQPLWLSEDMVISGTIPPAPDYKATEYFLVKAPAGGYMHDPMDHEQFLAIRGRDGIYLFSGCSHKGIAAALDYAKVLFPGVPLAGVVAGMHLFTATPAARQAVMARLEAEHLRVIVPMHCTGMEALVMMKTHFADRCLLASAGKRFLLEE
jgi:7,8-dihydropterin-6-yl-methyl-4-(beta-D-ribofuranosyl)aminobenzene 5'-phosphate synthase